MGSVKIRYYVTRQREGKKKWGYWAPCLARRNKKTGQIEPTPMAKMGFKLIDCGEDGPAAWAIAHMWNAKWDAARRGQITTADATPPARVYPPGSIGEGYMRFRATASWQDKKPRTKEDWERGWKHIDPIFGDVDPNTVSFEDIDLFYGGLPDNPNVKGILQRLGVRESHRVLKIWRALWKVLVAMKYTQQSDPSLGIRRKNPGRRSAIWFEGEAVRLVKRAWRMNFKGLAAALAVAWDTQLSVVDVRKLTPGQLFGDQEGPLFKLSRTKTGKSAIGTLSKRTIRLLNAYMDSLGFDLHDDAPIFRTPGAAPGPKGGRRWMPVPYTKDVIAKHFRWVREAEFKGDQRKVSDFRRSGAVEAIAGGVAPEALAGKMANTIDQNRELQATYLPNVATVVRLVDQGRVKGRSRMRGGGGTKEG